MCGEKPNRILWEHWKEGSPPHVRGKGDAVAKGPSTVGITPACAGKSGPPLSMAVLKEDHPRMCGEKADARNGTRYREGSPPRMRGKVSR